MTLTPKSPFSLAKPVQLTVVGTGASGLQDTLGRLIDGDDDGQGGSNAVAVLTKKSVKFDAVELARTSRRTAAPEDRLKVAVGAVASDPVGGPLDVPQAYEDRHLTTTNEVAGFALSRRFQR